MKEKLIQFIKKETVLVVAALLAVLSAFFVTPSAAYIQYIDFRVLGILLSLMIVMAGFQENGLFDSIGSWLLHRTTHITTLCLILVFLCFFTSMLITNDVALITFVPFAMLTLRHCNKEHLLIPVIVAQTIAANLGSMLTPLGNPQNLYLYNLAGYSFGEFIRIMLPYCAVSGILLFIWTIIFSKKEKNTELSFVPEHHDGKPSTLHHKNMIYIVLFVLCLLVVVRLIPYYFVLLLILVTTFIMDKKVLKSVDYCLIFTFIFFFVFTGNLGELPSVRTLLAELVSGREVGIGILASQFISNVPAALLLSGFSKDLQDLLIGVNLGGLGTLIASMASLISYKLYAHTYNESKGKYFISFTVANILFLVLLGALHIILLN